MIRAVLAIVVAGISISAAWAADMNDPFYLSPKIPRGKYAWLPINTKIKRSGTILNGTPYTAGYEVPEGYWLVANVFHNREFYIALVPKDAVARVDYLSQPFGRFLNHSMLRFQMEKPVLLVAVNPTAEEFARGEYGRKLEQPIVLNDLVLSVEATSPEGVPEFATFASFLSTRGLVFRFLSLTGRGVKDFTKGMEHVEQIPLAFDSAHASQGLAAALTASHEVGMAQMYNTAFSNCFTHCLRVIGKSAGKKVNFLNWSRWWDEKAAPLPNLERDPEFLRLAASYPSTSDICGKYLSK